MNQVAKVLMSYGMDFQYENYGSRGEKIISFELGVEVWNQDGKVIFEHCGQRTDLDKSEFAFRHVSQLTEQACIEVTT